MGSVDFLGCDTLDQKNDVLTGRADLVRAFCLQRLCAGPFSFESERQQDAGSMPLKDFLFVGAILVFLVALTALAGLILE